MFPFPDRPRLWGVAVSHYQVEGGDPCDWSDWTSRGGPCGAAVGSWDRYEDDALLARDIGANAFRFSISWSRVESDPHALARYRRFVEHLLAHDLEPAVTLFHYTHPRDFHELTPWTSPASVDRFARFAAKAADALGDLVRFWIPLNEPLVFLLAGFLDAQIPPGIAQPRVLARVFDHLLAAHVAAAAAIRERSPRAAIGIAHNMMGFAPERRWNPLDRLLARTAHRMYNRGVIEAFATGRWSFFVPPATMLRGRRDDLQKSLDVFGVNFYSRLHMRSPGRERMIGDFAYRDRSGIGLTDNGWEVIPSALGAMLDEAPDDPVDEEDADGGDQAGEDRLLR
ncbi:MAG TPA: family 1 glycosylhydrolase [Thermoanaerobaculia bacterium]|nr:family 1 glycosylhydrolase [Thermoanaerobaculia bacterium]